MSRWYGKVGYIVTAETAPDVYTESIVERTYTGDMTKQYNSVTNGEGINKNIQLSMQVSIVADRFAYEHFQDIRYVTVYKSKWEVSSVDATNRPRLILSLGGVYKEETE